MITDQHHDNLRKRVDSVCDKSNVFVEPESRRALFAHCRVQTCTGLPICNSQLKIQDSGSKFDLHEHEVFFFNTSPLSYCFQLIIPDKFSHICCSWLARLLTLGNPEQSKVKIEVEVPINIEVDDEVRVKMMVWDRVKIQVRVKVKAKDMIVLNKLFFSQSHFTFSGAHCAFQGLPPSQPPSFLEELSFQCTHQKDPAQRQFPEETFSVLPCNFFLFYRKRSLF